MTIRKVYQAYLLRLIHSFFNILISFYNNIWTQYYFYLLWHDSLLIFEDKFSTSVNNYFLIQPKTKSNPYKKLKCIYYWN